jgi:hypothetical protein
MGPETRATSVLRDDSPASSKVAPASTTGLSDAVPNRKLAILRWSILLAALTGLAFALAQMPFLWTNADLSLGDRLNEGGSALTEAAYFFIACLIAWRGAHRAGNLWIALSLTTIYWNGLLIVLLPPQHVPRAVRSVALLLTFFLGAGSYIRASQEFPQTITPADLAESPTLWGRIRPLRMVLTLLLSRPMLVWMAVACATVLNAASSRRTVIEAVRLMIVALGVIYFYVSYRSGNAESRRKVLWFLANAACALMFSLVGIAVRTVLGSSGSALLRTVISVTLNSASHAAAIACVAAAVFYAGAISPTLVIRKTVVYGVSVALFLFAFASVEAFVAEHLVSALHVTDHFASAVIGGIFGLAFHPLRRRIEMVLEKFHPKHRLATAI